MHALRRGWVNSYVDAQAPKRWLWTAFKGVFVSALGLLIFVVWRGMAERNGPQAVHVRAYMHECFCHREFASSGDVAANALVELMKYLTFTACTEEMADGVRPLSGGAIPVVGDRGAAIQPSAQRGG